MTDHLWDGEQGDRCSRCGRDYMDDMTHPAPCVSTTPAVPGEGEWAAAFAADAAKSIDRMAAREGWGHWNGERYVPSVESEEGS